MATTQRNVEKDIDDVTRSIHMIDLGILRRSFAQHMRGAMEAKDETPQVLNDGSEYVLVTFINIVFHPIFLYLFYFIYFCMF